MVLFSDSSSSDRYHFLIVVVLIVFVLSLPTLYALADDDMTLQVHVLGGQNQGRTESEVKFEVSPFAPVSTFKDLSVSDAIKMSLLNLRVDATNKIWLKNIKHFACKDTLILNEIRKNLPVVKVTIRCES